MFGEDKDISYRLVSLMFGALTVIITFFMLYRKNGYIDALIAAGVLASSWEFFEISRWILVDIALVFGVTLAMYAYLRWIDRRKLVDSIILGIALGIAFMAKGLVGPAIIAAAIITDIVRQRDIRIIWSLRPVLVIIIMLLAIMPWMIGLYNRGGWPFVREVIVVNNIMRFTGAAEGAALGHQQGIFSYLGYFPKGFLPWTFLFIPAFVASVRRAKDNPYVSWFIGPFILMSIASTKRGIYLVPIYPAAACMVATWLGEKSHMRWEDVMIKITWIIAILGCFYLLLAFFWGTPSLV